MNNHRIYSAVNYPLYLFIINCDRLNLRIPIRWEWIAVDLAIKIPVKLIWHVILLQLEVNWLPSAGDQFNWVEIINNLHVLWWYTWRRFIIWQFWRLVVINASRIRILLLYVLIINNNILSMTLFYHFTRATWLNFLLLCFLDLIFYHLIFVFIELIKSYLLLIFLNLLLTFIDLYLLMWNLILVFRWHNRGSLDVFAIT